MRQLFAGSRTRRGVRHLRRCITGETGTGKEEVARAIHALSPRAAAPALRVRLRGGAGGADRERALRPRARRVDGRGTGTVLACWRRQGRGRCSWNQVTELPLELQARLLRVLESKELRAAGRGERTGGTFEGARAGDESAQSLRRGTGGKAQAGASTSALAAAALTLPPLRERRDTVPCSPEQLAGEGPRTVGDEVNRRAAGVLVARECSRAAQRDRPGETHGE